MSWDLTAVVEPARPEDLGGLLEAWAAAFGDAISEAELRGGPGDRPHRETIVGAASVRRALPEWAVEHVRGDGALDVMLQLEVAPGGQTRPFPCAEACGPRHDGPQGTGRRAPLVLSFGNRRAYREGVELVGGPTLDDAFVRRSLETLCRALRPRTLILEEEQATGLQLNAHLVYHRDLGGFEQDVRDIAHLTLLGGAGLDGARAHIPTLSESLHACRMAFAGRRPERSRALVRFLEAHAPALLDPARPWSLERETMEQALLESEELDFFVDGDGVGVAAVPFLTQCCEAPYLSLIENTARRLGGVPG